jgi:hypothetical protein
MASRRPEVVCCAESKAMVAAGSGASSIVVAGIPPFASASRKTISVSPICMRPPCVSATGCSSFEPLY